MQLTDMPPECLVQVGTHLTPRACCTLRLVCKELAAVQLIGPELCQRVWRMHGVPATEARATFIERYRRMAAIVQARIETPTEWAACITPLQAEYRGTLADANDDRTVGVAIAPTPLCPLPFGGTQDSDGLVRVLYYEARVVDAGEHGFIAVGWCRALFPMVGKQPGWERNSYGFHGDDGRAYHATGWGKLFGPTFSTGDVVGTGLVIPSPSVQGKTDLGWIDSPHIFYTLNGSLVGAPFKDVKHPEILHAAVGLHSPGEKVELNFGACGLQDAANIQPGSPSQQMPFIYDIQAHAEKLALGIVQAFEGAPTAAASWPPAAATPTVDGQWRAHLGLGILASAPHHDPTTIHVRHDLHSDSSSDDVDEGYRDLLHRIHDDLDSSPETRAELLHFLRANVDMSDEAVDALDMQSLRQLCHVIMVELTPSDDDEHDSASEGVAESEDDELSAQLHQGVDDGSTSDDHEDSE